MSWTGAGAGWTGGAGIGNAGMGDGSAGAGGDGPGEEGGTRSGVTRTAGCLQPDPRLSNARQVKVSRSRHTRLSTTGGAGNSSRISARGGNSALGLRVEEMGVSHGKIDLHGCPPRGDFACRPTSQAGPTVDVEVDEGLGS